MERSDFIKIDRIFETIEWIIFVIPSSSTCLSKLFGRNRLETKTLAEIENVTR